MSNKIKAWGIALLLVISGTFAFYQITEASWVDGDNGKQYELEDGSLAVGFQAIKGKDYYFDKDGYLVTGKFYDETQDAYYYADENGVIQVGVISDGEHFYITDANGKLKTGFVDYDQQRYYFNSKANLVTGWFELDDNWYYADAEGRVQTGFVEQDGKRFYLLQDGTRVRDRIREVEGGMYVFRADGSVDEMATALYPVYQYMNNVRADAGLQELSINDKIQACAVNRAGQLKDGYGWSEDSVNVLNRQLRNRGVLCEGGEEFAYGGMQTMDMNTLITILEKDTQFKACITDKAVTQAGIGIYEENGISYYDIIVCKMK